MIKNSSSPIFSYFNELVQTISNNNLPISHWVALKHINVSDPDSCEWKWKEKPQMDAKLSENDTLVIFHPDFSSGTEIVEGEIKFVRGKIYFWEIELLSPVYGTDMMVGISEEEVNSGQYQFVFRSPLGENEHSWGISYHGYTQHSGIRTKLVKNLYPPRLGDGTKIALDLDTWSGKTTLYINGVSQGVVWWSEKFLRNAIRPVIASTAARTKMKLRTTQSTEASLQYLASKVLSQNYSMSELIKLSHDLNFSYKIYLDYYWLFHD